MDDPGDSIGRIRRRHHASAVATNNEVFVRLVVAATVTFTVIVGAALLYVVPLGRHSPRGIVTTLDRFMTAGAAGDTVAGRLTLSSDLLRPTRLPAVDGLLATPQRFYGYSGLQLRSHRIIPAQEVGGIFDTATATAIVRYDDGTTATLGAVLVLEDDTWRINDLRLTPSGGRP